jgi:adenosylhomocysteine nucleosidase
MFITLLASIGIISAMPQEAHLILNQIEQQEIVEIGTHQFVKGLFEDTPVVFSLSGVGKVSAATTATLLVTKFDVNEIVFTGVAGGGNGTEIGDIVIGSSYLQHDLDLRPIFPQFYIYSLNEQLLHADSDMVSRMKVAADRFFQQGISFPDLGITAPKVHIGVIASGDQFISNITHHHELVDKTKELLPNGFQAIEMEGAAVAQVCNELRVPFVVMRSISDKANQEAAVDFLTFMDQVAGKYSFGVLKEYIQSTSLSPQKF